MGTEDAKPKPKRFGGLQGKARHDRFRKRARQLHSQRLIEEFVDPEKQQQRTPRHIPIKHRAEFVPSAPVMGSKYGTGTEQELELVYSTESESCNVDGGLFDGAYALVPPDSQDHSAITFSASTGTGRRDQDDTSVEPAERDALFGDRRKETGLGEGDRSAIESFTARGFAFGCAIGTAAAAVLLMMVRVAFL